MELGLLGLGEGGFTWVRVKHCWLLAHNKERREAGMHLLPGPGESERRLEPMRRMLGRGSLHFLLRAVGSHSGLLSRV